MFTFLSGPHNIFKYPTMQVWKKSLLKNMIVTYSANDKQCQTDWFKCRHASIALLIFKLWKVQPSLKRFFPKTKPGRHASSVRISNTYSLYSGIVSIERPAATVKINCWRKFPLHIKVQSLEYYKIVKILYSFFLNCENHYVVLYVDVTYKWLIYIN